MGKIWIARKPCGCVTAAALEPYPDLAQDLGEWLLRGDEVIWVPDTTRIPVGKCEACRRKEAINAMSV